MSSLFSRMTLNVVQKYKYLVVLDFESTCWENRKYQTQEIIEFPAVLLNTSNGKIESEFQYYVQPQENPTLSSFCKQLTGITQEQVDEGIPLALCLVKFTHWIENLERKYNIMFVDANYTPDGVNAGTIVTWTDWDLNVCLHYEAKRKQLKIPYQLNNWIDLKLLYKNFYQKKPNGLNGALENAGLRFEGKEHSGIDDSRNTAYLAWKMIKDGCEMKITKSLTPTPTVKSHQTTLTQQLKCKKRVNRNPGKRSINEKENCEKWKGASSPDKCKISGSSSAVASMKPYERDKNKGLSLRNENIPNKRRIIASEQNLPKKLKALSTPEKLKDITENSLPSIPRIESCGKSLLVRNEIIQEKKVKFGNDSVPNKIPFTRSERNQSTTKPLQAIQFTTKISVSTNMHTGFPTLIKDSNPMQANQFTAKSPVNTNMNASFPAFIKDSNSKCTYKPFSVYDKKLGSSKMNSAWQVTRSDKLSSKNSLMKKGICSPSENTTSRACKVLFKTSLKPAMMSSTADIDVTTLQKEINDIEKSSLNLSNDQKDIFHHNEESCHLKPSKVVRLPEYSKSNVAFPSLPKSAETKPGFVTRDLDGDTKLVAENIQVNKSDTRIGKSMDYTKVRSPKNQFNFVLSENRTKNTLNIYARSDKNKVDGKSVSLNKPSSIENKTNDVTTETTDCKNNNTCTNKSNFSNKKTSTELADGHLKFANETKRGATASSKGSDSDGNPKKRQRTVSFSEMSATPPVCNCGKRTKKRIVQNPGPNVGRFFYSCSLGSRNSTRPGCGFFQWEKKVVVSKVSHSYSTFHINSYLTRPKDRDNLLK